MQLLSRRTTRQQITNKRKPIQSSSSHIASISIPFTGRATGEQIADEREAVEEPAVDGVCGFGGILVLVLK